MRAGGHVLALEDLAQLGLEDFAVVVLGQRCNEAVALGALEAGDIVEAEAVEVVGRKIGANSTPTWFLETGERYSGAVPLEELRMLLDDASPTKP